MRTSYSISIDGYYGDLFEEDFVSQFLEWGDPFENDCKWYDHEEDMKRISKNYPEMVFHLHGEGEQPGDLWDKHFKDGKMQVCRAKLVYDDYDENKLV